MPTPISPSTKKRKRNTRSSRGTRHRATPDAALHAIIHLPAARELLHRGRDFIRRNYLASLTQKIFLYEQHSRIKLEIGILFLSEAVAFILGREIPDRRSLFP